MGNPFIHVELMSTDPKKVQDFYGKLFDWQFENMCSEGMDYHLIKVGDGTGGGLMKNPIPDAPSMWMPYVLVDDLNAATAKAQSLGATLCRERTEVPEMGWFTIIVDPAGAMVGLWELNKAYMAKKS